MKLELKLKYIAGTLLQRERDNFISCSHGCVDQQKINESMLNTISPWSKLALKFFKLDLGGKSESAMALPPSLHSRCLSRYVAQGFRCLCIEAIILSYLFNKISVRVVTFIINILTGTHGDSTHITVDCGAEFLRVLFKKNLFIDFRERERKGGRERGKERERKTLICCSIYVCIHWLILVCALTVY